MRGRRSRYVGIAILSLIAGIFLQFSDGNSKLEEYFVPDRQQTPPFLENTDYWADSVLQSLTLEEKIAQLFMVAAYPEKGLENKQKLEKLIKEYHIGGLIMFQGNPWEVSKLTNYYQSISKTPLLISIDGEWGLDMRLDSTIRYPRQMMLGAIQDETLIYEMGKDIAQQLQAIGIHMNFAPVVDVNNNPLNPVINSRSFGEKPFNVAKKAYFYMKGMQDNKVLAVGKHFPGHGDTQTDSHHALPVILHTRERLDSLELMPFRSLINNGVGGIMMAHMSIPSLDSTPKLPSTLSPLIADTLLQKELGFKGLVVTDAMNMRGVADYYSPIDANIMAIKAGNDILLMPAEVEKSIKEIAKEVAKGEISDSIINARCKKILLAKRWAIQNTVNEKYSNYNINRQEYQLTNRKLIEASLTVIQNKNELLPLKRLDTLKIAAVTIGSENGNSFVEMLQMYSNIKHFNLCQEKNDTNLAELKKELSAYNLVIFSLHTKGLWASNNFNLKKEHIAIIENLLAEFPALVVNFSSPYILSQIKNLSNASAILESYENDETTQSLSAQLIFGAIGATGKLPVTVNTTFPQGTGFDLKPLNRLKYTLPIEAGMDGRKFGKVDSLVYDALNAMAMPGCQIIAVRDGKVIFHKAYGYHTYKQTQKTKITDIYDIASLTKIVATVPSLMYLENKESIHLDDTIGKYLPELDTTNKASLKISDILLHQAGLEAFIPFYLSTIEPVHPSQDIFSTKYSEQYPIQIGNNFYANKHIKYKDSCFSPIQTIKFPIPVAEGLYMSSTYVDSIKLKIYSSKLKEHGKYLYSDLGFYLFNWMIEKMEGKSLDRLTDSLFYKTLGAYTLGYKPLERFNKDQIIPTENDLIFRKQILDGYVHDPGAAMLGGVSGHAGLFSNANDVAKFMQIYLNGGHYGGINYLNKNLIDHYTDCLECKNGNRRGLGFDKPHPDTTLPGPAFSGISTRSYGHMGFTGTMTWVDPKEKIVYVFLSNRVYPDALNTKLAKMDVRTNIQKAIYETIINPD